MLPIIIRDDLEKTGILLEHVKAGECFTVDNYDGVFMKLSQSAYLTNDNCVRLDSGTRYLFPANMTIYLRKTSITIML